MSRRLLNISLISSSIVLGLGLGYFYIKRKSLKQPNSKLVLHHINDSTTKCVSLSPDLIKLETWFRMTNIKYEIEFNHTRFYSYKNTPWVSNGDIELTDVDEIISYLTRIYGTDLSDCLNHVEKSIARSFSALCKQSLEKCLMVDRFVYGKRNELSFLEFMINRYLFKRRLDSKWSKEKTMEIGIGDLTALEKFLRDKKYLFGSSPCVEDAVVFSLTSQFLNTENNKLGDFIKEKCHGLLRHYETIRKLYWKDWNDRLK